MSHYTPGVDPVLAHCLATSGIPDFLLTAVISEGRIPEVYARLVRRLGDRPLTADDAKIVEQVVYEVIDASQEEEADVPVEPAQVTESAFLPDESPFPPPRTIQDPYEKIAMGGPDQPTSSNALDHLKDRITLQRVEASVARWRAGEVSPEVALEHIENALANLRTRAT